MTSPTVTRISECFVKPLHDLSPDTNQPIHFTPFELVYSNANYSQMGLLYAKPSLLENKDFSITTYSEALKQSLSSTLSHFYPLAARLSTRKTENPASYVIYIDPKDSPGVKFVYAMANNVSVFDIRMSSDVPLVVHSFFDMNNVINHDGHTLPLLAIQVTELVDGIFIGVTINHLLADGTSFWNFMAVWSEIFMSREKESYIISRPPIFKRWALEGYDPIINLSYNNQDQFIERLEHNPELKERFFHFTSASVLRLKAKANKLCNMQKISSLQAVCAHVWRCVIRVRRLPPYSETVCKLVIGNRSRLNPPLSDNYFGNPVARVKGTATVEDLMAHDLGWAAFKLHEAVNNHDNTKVIRWVKSWFKNPVIYKMSGYFPKNIVHFGSSPRFDMYGCEFGLGKPVAVRSGLANKADGKITLYPGREGGGSMDVEVCLLPEYMMDLQCDEEFISALSSN